MDGEYGFKKTIGSLTPLSPLPTPTTTQLNIRYDEIKESEFWEELGSFNLGINEIVWMDESHYDDRNLNPKYGRALKHKRAKYTKMFGRGKRYSIIGGCNVHGLLTYKIIDSLIMPSFCFCFWFFEATPPPYSQYVRISATCNTEVFFRFVMICLWPFFSSGVHNTLILDNASIHRNPIFLCIMRSLGVRVVFLSPYSPHLNPMELHFNRLKKQIVQHRMQAKQFPVETIKQCLEKQRSHDVTNPLRKVGYFEHVKA